MQCWKTERCSNFNGQCKEMQASSAKMQQKYAKVKSVLCQNGTGIGLKCASMAQIVPLFLQKCYLKADTQMGHFCTKLPPQTLQEIGNPVVPTINRAAMSSSFGEFCWTSQKSRLAMICYDTLDSFSDLQKYPDISRFSCIECIMDMDLSSRVDSRQGASPKTRRLSHVNTGNAPIQTISSASLGVIGTKSYVNKAKGRVWGRLRRLRRSSVETRCLQTVPSNGKNTN